MLDNKPQLFKASNCLKLYSFFSLLCLSSIIMFLNASTNHCTSRIITFSISFRNRITPVSWKNFSAVINHVCYSKVGYLPSEHHLANLKKGKISWLPFSSLKKIQVWSKRLGHFHPSGSVFLMLKLCILLIFRCFCLNLFLQKTPALYQYDLEVLG